MSSRRVPATRKASTPAASKELQKKQEALLQKYESRREGLQIAVLEIGHTLHEMQGVKAWEVRGYKTAAEYHNALGDDSAKVRRYLSLYLSCCHEVGIKPEQVVGVDPDLLMKARRKLTPETKIEIIKDAKRVSSGKLPREKFIERHGPAPEESGPPDNDPQDAEKGDFSKPASQRTKLDEVMEWVHNWKPEQIDRLLDRMAEQLGARVWGPDRLYNILKGFDASELSTFMTLALRHPMFQKHPDVVQGILTTFADMLDYDDLMKLAERLDALAARKKKARRKRA